MMAKTGGRGGKVLSSGRLNGPVRLANGKKRTAVRKVSTPSADSGYSLYSTDSEDQVLVINKGLDQCAALLKDILHNDVTERAQPRSHSAPHTKGNVRSSAVKMKRNIPRRPTTAGHVHKEIASLRKSASSGVSDAEERPGASVRPSIVPVTRPALCEHVQTQMSLLNGPSTRMNCNGIRAASAQPALEHGPEGATFFNCRLPTSTPTLSPQHSSHPRHFGHEGYNQVLPQGGAAHFPSGFITTALSAPTVMSYAPAPGQHDPAVPSYQPTCEANTVLQLGNNGQQIRESDLLQCIAAHLAQLQRCETQDQKPGSPAETVCERDEPRRGEIDQASSEEDEDFNQLDMAPVRDIGCQTSFDKNSLKPKKSSPEKAERKIKTVKYLLGEIKALVADQVDDGEALRLVTELEHIVCLLPAVVGSTNVHAEIALALQPLRSENAQLRRRLRILNQQLRDRERAASAARSDEHNFELISLQSMNMTLQHQLNKSQKGLESLRSNNEELLKVIDIQKDENKKFAKIIQEKEGERLKLWQQSEIAATTGKIEVEDVLGKMKDFQCKLEASGKEKEILGITLRQRDAEVSRLRELIRTLQDSMAKLLSDLSQDNAKSTSGNNLTKSLLDSYERQLQSDQCPASTSIMSYLKKLETDHVFPNTEAIFSEKPVPPKAASKMYTCCVTSDLSEDFATSKAPRDSHRDTYQRSEYICIPEKPSTDARSDSGPLTCDQFKPDETMYLPMARSPSKKQLAPSLRQICTPPTADLEPGGYESSSAHRKHSGCGGPEESQVASDGEFGVKKVLTNASEMPGRSIKLGEGFPEMEKYPVAVFSADVQSVSCPPTLQQMKNLQIKDGDPSDHSMLDFMSGKSDWSTSSFSTFTSHDEQDFRNGLAALDANIAKLQRTLQADFSNK